MVVLMLFGFVAGAGTALSPCVLPVLPIALSAGATGGRRRPLGIVVGLAVSFTFATVALVYVISALGLPDDLLRNLAIAVLLAFGITLMIPPLAARVEAMMSRFAGRAGVAGGGGDGFWSGTAVGASLGLVYAPCAGPILAGVITVSASQPFTAGRLAVALSYGIGSAVVLYFLMLGGRRLTAPLARRGGRPAGDDGRDHGRRRPGDGGRLRHQVPEPDRQLAAELPRQPDRRRSRTPPPLAAPSNDVRGQSDGIGAIAGEAAESAPKRTGGGGGGSKASDLPVLGTAPEFVGNQAWFNTPDGKPITLQAAARPRRPRRLLDLQLHQLPAHPALPDRLGQDLPQGRPDDRRRPLARVPLRERRGQRRRRDRAQRDPLSGRSGQRPRDLERLRQPVLAGRVLHRRSRAGSDMPTSARANTRRRSRSSASCWPKRAARSPSTSREPRASPHRPG